MVVSFAFKQTEDSFPAVALRRSTARGQEGSHYTTVRLPAAGFFANAKATRRNCASLLFPVTFRNYCDVLRNYCDVRTFGFLMRNNRAVKSFILRQATDLLC